MAHKIEHSVSPSYNQGGKSLPWHSYSTSISTHWHRAKWFFRRLTLWSTSLFITLLYFLQWAAISRLIHEGRGCRSLLIWLASALSYGYALMQRVRAPLCLLIVPFSWSFILNNAAKLIGLTSVCSGAFSQESEDWLSWVIRWPKRKSFSFFSQRQGFCVSPR